MLETLEKIIVFQTHYYYYSVNIAMFTYLVNFHSESNKTLFFVCATALQKIELLLICSTHKHLLCNPVTKFNTCFGILEL